MRCECGCGWEGEDEVTQYLIEEAAYAVLDRWEAMARSGELDEKLESDRLLSRHAELSALRERLKAGG